MGVSFAANAVLSKARAMYGKRISTKSYNELIAFRSINDITSYLKRKTTYADVLADINENNVHRSILEDRLKMKLFHDFSTLGRYDLSVGEHFFEYIISRAEIDQFMHCLMLLTAKKPDEYVCTIPMFFFRHTKVNFRKLCCIKNYDDFLNVIKKSQYYKILLPFKAESNERLDLTGIETALYSHLYKIILSIINKYVKGPAKKKLIDFFKLYIDLFNLIRIIRMRKFYTLSEDYIMSGLIDFGSLTKEQLRCFVNSKNDKQMMADMKNTKMGKKWFSRGLDVIDKIPINMKYNWSRHNIRFSISPPIVLMSYIFLKEIEILNITNIIEGIKYRLPGEEIKKLLIILR